MQKKKKKGKRGVLIYRETSWAIKMIACIALLVRLVVVLSVCHLFLHKAKGR